MRQQKQRKQLIALAVVTLIGIILGATFFAIIPPVSATLINPSHDGQSLPNPYLEYNPAAGKRVEIVAESFSTRSYTEIRFVLYEVPNGDYDDESMWVLKADYKSGSTSFIKYQTEIGSIQWGIFHPWMFTELNQDTHKYEFEGIPIRWQALMPAEDDTYYFIRFTARHSDGQAVANAQHTFNTIFEGPDPGLKDYNPIVTVTSPKQDMVFANTNITFTVVVSDNQDGYGADIVDTVSINLSPSILTWSMTQISDDTWSITVDSTDIPNGESIILFTVDTIMSIDPVIVDHGIITIDNYVEPSPLDSIIALVIMILFVILIAIVLAVVLKFFILPILQSAVLVKQLRRK